MRSSSPFALLALVLAAAPAVAGELEFEEFALARSRLGGVVTGEGILLWTGDAAATDVEIRLAVHDASASSRDEFPAVRVDRIAAGRAVRVRCEDRGVAEFAAYELEVEYRDAGVARTVRFVGTDLAKPPVRDGGPGVVAAGAPRLEASGGLQEGEIRARVRHTGGPAAAQVLLAIRLLGPDGTAIEERTVFTGRGLGPGESLVARIGVAGDGVASAEVRALAATRVLGIAPAPIGSADRVEVGRHRFVVLASGETWGEVHLRNGTSDTLGDTRVTFAFAGGSGAEVARRTVGIPGPIEPGRTVRLEVRLEPGLAVEQYAYELAWDPPLDGASPRPGSRLGPADCVVLGEAVEPAAGTRVEVFGLRYVYREVLRGRTWVTKGGVYFLELRFTGGDGGTARPEGEVRVEVRRDGRTLGTARRRIDRKAWANDFARVDGRNVRIDVVAVDRATDRLVIGLFALGETREFDFTMDLEIEAGGATWSFRDLADPFREVPRPPGTWTDR